MDWQAHFGEVFFETWKKAGLPHPQDFSDEYIKARSGFDFENIWIQQPYEISPALEENLLRSIYGFGAMHGRMFSEMLKLNEVASTDVADWCGRFNLGISLFDYLCDETEGGPNRTITLKVFQPFIKTNIAEIQPRTPSEEYLSNLSESVLKDLGKIDLKNEGIQKSNELFKLMKTLFEAQHFLSKNELTDTAELKKIRKALNLKSAGPFEVMSKYAIGMADANDVLRLENVLSIGKAVGYCYWVIDDAKDVWIDLEAKQWNLFLQLAAQEEPQLFSKNSNKSIHNNLINIWMKENHAEKISEQVVKRLVKSLNQLEFSKHAKEHNSGLLSASLWYWYK